MNKGLISQVLGPVVDVEFKDGCLPAINNALRIDLSEQQNKGIEIHLTLEVALHLGNNIVRCIAMDATEGLRRGMLVIYMIHINTYMIIVKASCIVKSSQIKN